VINTPQPIQKLTLRFSGNDDLLRRFFLGLLERSPDVRLTDEAYLEKSSDRPWASFHRVSVDLRAQDLLRLGSPSVNIESDLKTTMLPLETNFVSRWANLNLDQIPIWAFSHERDKHTANATDAVEAKPRGARMSFAFSHPSLFLEGDTSYHAGVTDELVVFLQEVLRSEPSLFPGLRAHQDRLDPSSSVRDVARGIDKCLNEMLRIVPALRSVLKGNEAETIVSEVLSNSRPDGFCLEKSVAHAGDQFFGWNGPDMLALAIGDIDEKAHQYRHFVNGLSNNSRPSRRAREWILSKLSDPKVSPEELAGGVKEAFVPLSRQLLDIGWKQYVGKNPKPAICDVSQIFSSRIFVDLGNAERECASRLHEFMESLPKRVSEVKFKLATPHKHYLESIYQQAMLEVTRLMANPRTGEIWSKAGICFPNFTDAVFEVLDGYLAENPLLLALWCGIFSIRKHDNEVWVSLSPILIDLCLNESVLSKYNCDEREFCESFFPKIIKKHPAWDDSESVKGILKQLASDSMAIEKDALVSLLS
jgi:hypothetical protein